MVESSSDVSNFIPETKRFSYVTILSDDINKHCLKVTEDEIKNTINNHSFLFQDPEKGEPVTPYVAVYKAKIKSNWSLDELKLRIVVI